MKKSLIAAIVVLFSFSAGVLSYAQDSSTPENVSETVVVSMDENKAVAYALENSNAIKSVIADCNAKKYQVSDAKKSYDNFHKNPYEASSFEVSLLRRGYYVDMAQLQYDSSLRTLEIEKTNLKNQVKSDIYTYFNNKNKQALAEKNLENAEEKLTFAKARLDNGTISRLDYTLFELSALNARNSLSQAERNTALSLDTIKTTINLPKEKELKIIGTMPEIDITYAPPEEAIPASRTQNTYLVLSDSHNAAKKRFAAAEGYYFPHEFAYQIEKYTFEKAQCDFETNVNSLDSGIKSTYNKLLDIKNSIDYTEQYLDYLKKSTDVAYTKYEMGMITVNNYVDTEQEYFKAQNDYMDLLLNYRTAALQYRAIYTNDNITD